LAHYIFFENETYLTSVLSCRGFLKIKCQTQEKLKVKLEKKHRGGKAVTLIEGFFGKEEDLQTLGKALKNFCGTGGSVKDGEIIIQGDQREKILQWLIKNDYKNSRKI